MKSDKEFVDSLVRVVELNYTNPNFSIGSMAGEMEVCDRQLQRKVRALTGHCPVQYLRGFRLERSLLYLREGVPVGETANIVGFSSHTYFTSCFRSLIGITPHQILGDSVDAHDIIESIPNFRSSTQQP